MRRVDKYHGQDLDFIQSQNDKKPIHQPEKLISKFVNGLRIMPAGSPFPGIYDVYKTPYVIEPLNNMSPYDKTRNTAVKKSVQSAFTTGGGENTIAYYIKERPTYIQYMSGTDTLLKKFVNSRLDPLATSCGIRFFSQSTKKNNRSTGDTAQYKEFPGGKLTLGSLQSEASMRQESVQIMIRDEIDLIESQMSSGEGNTLKISDGRLVAYGERAKTLDYSTPREYGNSLIDIQYNKGDKRKFFVSCPMCGKRQYLVMGDEKSNYGLKGDYKAGNLIRGYYLCYHCHDAIFESSKMKMLANGIWLPTVENPPDKFFRSYHLPAFYSPPGMTSWTKMKKEYDEALSEGDDGMRSFTNLFLAKSFKPSGERPKFQSVIEIRSTYNSGTVPPGIMYLTASGDVQKGTKKYWEMTTDQILEEVKKIQASDKFSPKLKKIPRLEVEVMGHGRDFRTASIIYKEFYGCIDDYQSGAWEQLTNWMKETNLRFKRKDGYEFNVKLMGIDSGWGEYTDLVYSYCEQFPHVYALKGDKTPKKDKLKLTNIDEMNKGNIAGAKLSKSGAHYFILVSTNYYKRNIYRLLKNTFRSGEDQPPNSHQTPSDYPDSYFKGLTAEEQKTDGSFHNVAQRSNEPLDLMVYNKGMSDYWINDKMILEGERLKLIYKKRGRSISDEEIRRMTKRSIITDKLEAELRQKGW